MGIKNLEIRNAKYNLQQLKENHLKGKKQKFLFFWGHQPSKDGSIIKTCFSQWWKSVFIENGRKYCCMEQYMMAKKAELFEDDEDEKDSLVFIKPNEENKNIGSSFIKDIHGPIPTVQLMPSGGVSLENIKEWKDKGAVAVGVGSALSVKVGIEGYESVTEIAKKFVSALEG